MLLRSHPQYATAWLMRIFLHSVTENENEIKIYLPWLNLRAGLYLYYMPIKWTETELNQ